MNENFAEMLAVGGKSNSLGRTDEVIESVLYDKTRIEELYSCLFNEDSWIRMRAADAMEKVCREHPGWLQPYIDRFARELATSTQASVRWHLAQIYAQVDLTHQQKQFAINWLEHLLSDKNIDWIVAANAMDTLVQFTKDGSVQATDTIALLKIQQKHKSNAVIKRATNHLAELTA
jgi:hypothetical protein